MIRVTWRQVARVTFGLCITVVFLWMVVRRVDLHRVIIAMTEVRWYVVPLALTFLAGGYTLRICRWWWMLRACDSETKLSSCAWPLIVAVAVNNVAPLRIGDALRVVGFREQLRASTTRLVATLLIERMLDTTVLLAFLTAGIAGLNRLEGSAVYAKVALAAGLGVLLAWTLLLLFGDTIENMLRRACRHPMFDSRGLSEGAERQVRQLFGALGIVRVPARALALLMISTVIWGLEGAVFQTIAWGLSYHGAWYGPWFAFSTGTLSTLIPSSPGYVGTFDFFAMTGLMAYGANRGLSAAFAFLVHLVLWLPLTLAGLAYAVLPASRIARGGVTAAARRGS